PHGGGPVFRHRGRALARRARPVPLAGTADLLQGVQSHERSGSPAHEHHCRRRRRVKRSGRLGFVPSRYGPEVVGGAETVFREMSHGLAARGWDVDILTTAARDHFTWENVYPLGEQQDDGVVVRRFPAVISTPRTERAAFENAIHNGLPLTIDDQQ